MVFQLMGLFGQPNASAMGRHMAMPSGAMIVGLHSAPIRLWPPFSCFHCSSNSSTHDCVPGDQTTGFNLSFKMSSMDLPDSTGCEVIVIVLPSLVFLPSA